MCWNAEVSLNTFIFGIVSAIIVLILNKLKYHLVLILLSFTSIQLLEYFAWKNLNNKKVIRILSIIGIQIIFIQLLLLNYYLPPTQKQKIILTSAVVITYILFLLFQFPYVKLDMEKSKINKHLIWHWLDLPLFWLVIGFLFYLIPCYLTNNIYVFTFGILTLTFSLYNYYKYKTWGSMWCYISNSLWIFAIIISILY
jgi:hypothetical protein